MGLFARPSGPFFEGSFGMKPREASRMASTPQPETEDIMLTMHGWLSDTL